jgi:DNA polymerase-3 subunit epsilon
MISLLKHMVWHRRPHELIEQNRNSFRGFDKSLPLSDYSFVVYDTELTGLDRKQDEIVSIGAVRIKDLKIELGDTFHYYVQPENLDHTTATLVHRITPEQLKQAPPLEEVLPRFLSFITDDLLVGHFVGIDMAFLNRATKKVFHGTVANPYIDTLRMAQIYKRLILGRVHENSTSAYSQYNLQSLTSEFNLPFFDAHDALEDALQTAYLFLFLAKKLRSEGVVSLSDLYAAGRGINWATL